MSSSKMSMNHTENVSPFKDSFIKGEIDTSSNNLRSNVESSRQEHCEHDEFACKNENESCGYTCEMDSNIHSCVKHQSANQYCCGACTSKFKTLCFLHDHLKVSHRTGGSFHYDHKLLTAFPKYESCCQFTQTVCESMDTEDNAILYSDYQRSEGVTKNAHDNLINKSFKAIHSKLLGPRSDEFSSSQHGRKCKFGTVRTNVDEIKPERHLSSNNESKTDTADYDSDRTDGYLDDDTELEEKFYCENKTQSQSDVKYSTFNSNENGKHQTKGTSNSGDTKRKRKQSSPKSIKKSANNPKKQKLNVKLKTDKSENDKYDSDNVQNSESNSLPDQPSESNSKCDICGAKFSFKRGLLRHEQAKHANLMKHKCKSCDQKFMREFNLMQHVKCVHKTDYDPNLKDQSRIKRKTKSGNGRKSVKSTEQEILLEYNVDNSVEQAEDSAWMKDGDARRVLGKKESPSNKAPHTCTICGHTMPRSKMDVHQRLHSGERPFICHVCGKGLISQNKLKRHMLIHSETKKHSCDVCGAGFQMKYKLRMHQHIHTGKKPYLCSICGAEFNHSSNLATHTRCVHLQVKPFSCNTCGGRYSKKSQLDDHLLSHSTEKQYTCRYCGKSFKYYKGMKRHEKSHYEEKSFPCDKCTMKFSRRDNLERHKQSHEEPHLPCKTCKKMFRDEKLLKEHERSHLGEKPFQCVLCGEAYKAQNQYNTHMLAAHGIEKDKAKLMHEERLAKVTLPQTIEKNPSVQVDINQPLRLDSDPVDMVKVSQSMSISPSPSINQVVSGIMDENRAAINVLTRVATQNLRLHSEDIQEEEKLNVIVPPLNPMILLERNQGFSSLTGASNMAVSIDNSSATSFVMLAPMGQSRESLHVSNSAISTGGNIHVPRPVSRHFDDSLRLPVDGRTNFVSLQMASNQGNMPITPHSVHSTYNIQDARITLESLARQHETVSVPMTLMRLSENMMDPPSQRQGQEGREPSEQAPAAGSYRIQNMF